MFSDIPMNEFHRIVSFPNNILNLFAAMAAYHSAALDPNTRKFIEATRNIICAYHILSETGLTASQLGVLFDNHRQYYYAGLQKSNYTYTSLTCDTPPDPPAIIPSELLSSLTHSVSLPKATIVFLVDIAAEVSSHRATFSKFVIAERNTACLFASWSKKSVIDDMELASLFDERRRHFLDLRKTGKEPTAADFLLPN